MTEPAGAKHGRAAGVRRSSAAQPRHRHCSLEAELLALTAQGSIRQLCCHVRLPQLGLACSSSDGELVQLPRWRVGRRRERQLQDPIRRPEGLGLQYGGQAFFGRSNQDREAIQEKARRFQYVEQALIKPSIWRAGSVGNDTQRVCKRETGLQCGGQVPFCIGDPFRLVTRKRRGLKSEGQAFFCI